MKVYNIKDMIGGWFVGNFTPTTFSTDSSEVCFKRYKAGGYEKKHIHKIATEITAIVYGKVSMNGVEYQEGDIVVMEPGEATDFKALTDASNIVVKIPCIKGDKYIVE